MIRTVYENEPFAVSSDEETCLRRILKENLEGYGRRVRVVRVAGHLRLPGGTTLVIRSRKAGSASLLSWIAHADQHLRHVKELGVVPELAGTAELGGFIARIFCRETWRAIQSSGLLKNYHREHIKSAVIRGRIDFARLGRSGGDLSRTPCVVFSRLPRTPLNQMLSATVTYIQRDPVLRTAVGASLGPLAAIFADVAPEIDKQLLEGRRELSRVERPFEASLALSRLILAGAGLGSGDEDPSPRFLVNLANLFEDTIAQALCGSYPSATSQYKVSVLRQAVSGVPAHSHYLYLDVFLPDFRGEKLIIDAKYKRKVSSSNLHQMVSYCWLTGARRAVLVCPSGQMPDRRTYVMQAGHDAPPIRIDVVEFDLGATSIEGWQLAAQRFRDSLLSDSVDIRGQGEAGHSRHSFL